MGNEYVGVNPRISLKVVICNLEKVVEVASQCWPCWYFAVWSVGDLNDDVTLICAWPSDNKDDLTGGVKVRVRIRPAFIDGEE
ncbi:unnamed protein product [Arabidopsis thaliana]|uniref:(thale cress) hypothetical protein n=1 Tax=Arabidopsis thaliana TaxID=3702 RepID=A0A7G2EQL5_ARATH|nr:unnamed protein product [Arabidopsis thaliana]